MTAQEEDIPDHPHYPLVNPEVTEGNGALSLQEDLRARPTDPPLIVVLQEAPVLPPDLAILQMDHLPSNTLEPLPVLPENTKNLQSKAVVIDNLK